MFIINETNILLSGNLVLAFKSIWPQIYYKNQSILTYRNIKISLKTALYKVF